MILLYVTFQNKTFRVDTSTHREASCLTYCAVADSNRNQWGLPEGGAKPGRSRNAETPIQWKPADSLAILVAKNNTQRS